MPVKKKNKTTLKSIAKESCRFELIAKKDNGQYSVKKIPHKLIHALFDLQFMMEPDTWKILKLNKINKEVSSFFRIVDWSLDCASDGRCYSWDENGVRLSRRKYYHSGRRPRWRKQNKISQ